MIRNSIFLLAVLIAGCSNQHQRQAIETEDPFEETVLQIVDTESLILDLGPYVSRIADALVESPQSKGVLREFFAAETKYTADENSTPRTTDFLLDELWQPFLGQRKFIECQFGTESGLLHKDKQRFDMMTVFEGKLRDGDALIGVKATQTITWTKINKLWTVTQWKGHSFDVSQSEPLFKDVTASCLPDQQTFEAVSRASHQERVLDVVRSKKVMQPMIDGLPGFNDWESIWQFPSASVVDYDGDGWDDVFLTDRWTGGQMLRNVRGQFEDVTKACGLSIGPHCNCVVFADFDNDGDPDAFVGRSIEDSEFFINENGNFQRDRSMTDELKLVRFVTAGSVADFNNDGLLDLYLSTYVSPSGSAKQQDWMKIMLPKSDWEKFNRLQSTHPFVDRSGPANILLINDHGKLKRCKIDSTLEQWRDSFQSVWHDWDRDGDQDLFICNDFAPDAFLRNDTTKGSTEPVFTDVTAELISPATMGYSMGGSWGDFDNDGDMDLYVSQMYSKAGKRILKQFAAADQRSRQSAQGNVLFRNDGDRFRQVAGSKASNIHVAKVGWSFGGQFADFDNDGWLDLYVPSGYYTAPKEVRGDQDL